MLRWLALTLSAAAVMLLVGALALVAIFSGPLADRILANAIGPEDQELPPTAYPIRATSADIQIVGGQGEGLNCSLPWGVDALAFRRDPRKQAPISLQMRQACAFHDYCYRHGSATYGYTQADCDFILQEQAFRLCTQISTEASVPDCETAARKVTLGVRMGGAGSFRRAGRVGGLRGVPYSTYFEFDPYPIRSTEYTVVRVADTPAGWSERGAIAKSLYVFTIRRSGTRVRVIGLKPGGESLCWGFDLAGEYGSLTLPPAVLRHAATGTDWLVWWRRESLENTGVTFDGVAPKYATQGDWSAVFGSVTYRNEPPCADAPFGSHPAERFEPRKAHFRSVRVKNEEGGGFDPLLSEFHPPLAADTQGLSGNELHLFGLTTHSCAKASDQSTCLAHVKIDPERDVGRYVQYRTLDPNCIASGHGSFAKAVQIKTGSCDRYRNFAVHLFVVSREGEPSVAWLRRGASNGDGYQVSAVLRWAWADNPKKELKNYTETELQAFGEELEPASWVRSADNADALFSITAGADCGNTLRFNIVPVLPPASPQGNLTADSSCQDGLDSGWLARPYSVVNGKDLIMLKTSVSMEEAGGNRRAKVTVEIASVSLGARDRAARTQSVGEVFVLSVCRVRQGSDAEWTVSAEPCSLGGSVRYGRIRHIEEAETIVARAMNSRPAVVAFMDDDAVADIALLNPADPSIAVWIKGEATENGVTWQLQRQ